MLLNLLMLTQARTVNTTAISKIDPVMPTYARVTNVAGFLTNIKILFTFSLIS